MSTSICQECGKEWSWPVDEVSFRCFDCQAKKREHARIVNYAADRYLPLNRPATSEDRLRAAAFVAGALMYRDGEFEK